jgi:hypothetical protein
MDKLFGLPAHPLLVHLPVVLTPLVCLGVVLAFVLPAGRRRYGYLLIGSAGVLFLSMVLATSSGGKLRGALRKAIGNAANHHAELGEMSRALSALLLVSVVAWVLLGQVVERTSGARPKSTYRLIVPILGGITVVVSVLLLIWTVKTGHEGAKLVWQTN